MTWDLKRAPLCRLLPSLDRASLAVSGEISPGVKELMLRPRAPSAALRRLFGLMPTWMLMGLRNYSELAL